MTNQNKDAQFCDDCGDELPPNSGIVHTTLPFDVSSANKGESAILCEGCNRTRSQTITTNKHHDDNLPAFTPISERRVCVNTLKAARPGVPTVGEAEATIRAIVAGHQHQRINGHGLPATKGQKSILVDAFSASALVAVLDALSEENKAKLRALSLVKGFRVAFKCLK